MELWVAGVLAFAVATLLVQGAAIVLAYGMRRIDPPSGSGRTSGPGVTVVIAARNEAEEIGRCLASLAASTYPVAATIVVDGGSTDGTAAAAAAFAEVQVVPEPPLPAAWVGKNWALTVGAGAATTPYLLFLDADVRLHPAALGSAVAWAETDGADLVSFAPRIEMQGFWERVVLPFYTQVVLTYFRTPHVNRPGSRAAMANGQFLLVRRAAYEAVGGHRAIASAVLEDVALARNFRAAARPMRFGWTPQLLTTRMYRDRHELFEGLLKNVHDTRFSALRQTAFLLGLAGFFLLPLAVLPLGFATGSALLEAVGAFLWIALFGKHVAFARAVGGRARDGLLYPVAVGFYLVLVGTSLVRGLRGAPMVWKGRSYALNAEGASAPGVIDR